jgi:hypothetical protein
MKKLLILLLITLSSMVLADITDKDEQFTVLCIDEMSTGFNWDTDNGRWYKTDFYLGKTLIKKVSSLGCFSKEEYLVDGELYNLRKGCYDIEEFGQSDEQLDQTCNETWQTEFNGGYKLLSVSCNNLSFVPNGEFSYSTSNKYEWHSINSKYSQVMTLGKCSTL